MPQRRSRSYTRGEPRARKAPRAPLSRRAPAAGSAATSYRDRSAARYHAEAGSGRCPRARGSARGAGGPRKRKSAPLLLLLLLLPRPLPPRSRQSRPAAPAPPPGSPRPLPAGLPASTRPPAARRVPGLGGRGSRAAAAGMGGGLRGGGAPTEQAFRKAKLTTKLKRKNNTEIKTNVKSTEQLETINQTLTHTQKKKILLKS